MIQIRIDTDNAAWLDGDAGAEMDYVLAQARRHFAETGCGPNGFARPLFDSNGNTTGEVRVSTS